MTANHPHSRGNGVTWLTVDEPESTETLLRRLGWLGAAEQVVGIERAGEGNMNLTLRVTIQGIADTSVATDDLALERNPGGRRSVILKQSRPWVEKYPQIEAPVERGLVEAQFYRTVQNAAGVADMMPKLLGSSVEDYVLLLEDLGLGSDFNSLYATDGTMSLDQVATLANYLQELHRVTVTSASEKSVLSNRAMRQLNHEHIFRVPFDPNNGLALDGFELGLASAAGKLQADHELLKRVESLGERYLADGDTFLHGDFFPGSWLATTSPHRLWVIDPEFCFLGDAEFDVGVALAHLALAAQPAATCRSWVDNCSDLGRLDAELVAGYAAIEVLRRVLGVAQLPLPAKAGFRAELVQRAAATLHSGDWSDLVR